MRLSRNNVALAATALAVLALLSACRGKDQEQRTARAASPDKSHTAWERINDSEAQREAERAYRACAREAALRHLPVREFPETSERVTYVNENGKRIKRSEHIGVAIDDMQVDNGCATQIVRSVSVDVLSDRSDSAKGKMTPDETGLAVAHDTGRRELADGEAQVQLAISRKTLPPQTCALKRDVGVQSHFMMLNLCWHEERRADALRQEESPQPPRKVARPGAAS